MAAPKNIEQRRRIRALEAKRDALIIKQGQVKSQLAQVRAALKTERQRRRRRSTNEI